MRRARRIGYLVVALALVAGWYVGPARGQGRGPAAAAGGGIKVVVEKTDGTTVEGTLLDVVFPVEADFGAIALNPQKVKALDFATGDAGLEVIAELTDKTHVTGVPKFAAVRVTTAAGEVAFDIAVLREVALKHPADTSVLGLAVGLVTLTMMEIVLGIDNIIFLAILAGRLPKHQQNKARQIGLAAALGTRLLLLFTLSMLLGLTQRLFTLPLPLSPDARDISPKDLVLLLGGAFLIYKSVVEMHHKIEEARTPENEAATGGKAGFAWTIVTIAFFDIVFSLDSVITAVGMVDTVWVMAVAMIIAMVVMLFFAGPISRFVDRHPTVKMLALAFLILIGVLLVAEGMGQHINKGYVYFAMAFAVVIEFVNMRLRGGPPAEEPAASSG